MLYHDRELDSLETFAFYGSLRKGEYNYARMIHESKGVTYIETKIVQGFDLYSLGAFPAAFPSNNPQAPLTVDIFKIENKGIRNAIDGMEIGAGYRRCNIGTKKNPICMYVAAGRLMSFVDDNDLVPSGDWLKRHPENEINAN